MPVHAPFCDVETALEEIRAGRMIVVIDDEDRENEGDLTMAAEMVTPEAINFMAKYGRGLICLAMTEERAGIPAPAARCRPRTPPTSARRSPNRSTPRTASPPASRPTIARTPFSVAIDPATRPSDLARPGHVFPLRARKGGVLVRAGQTEASVDLARLAGWFPRA